jgi:TolB-like protein
MISIGTFLVILEDGLFLNRKREAASNARRQAMYDAEGRVYREQERVRIQARNAEVSK